MTEYGLTEAGNVTLSRPGDSLEDLATTAGWPCEDVQVRVADSAGRLTIEGRTKYLFPVGGFNAPRSVEFRDGLPLNATVKVMKDHLR